MFQSALDFVIVVVGCVALSSELELHAGNAARSRTDREVDRSAIDWVNFMKNYLCGEPHPASNLSTCELAG
jgi:hypothetical protein